MPDSVTLSKEQIDEIVAAAKKVPPAPLEDFAINSLKVSPDVVSGIAKAYGVIGQVAGIVGSALGYYDTAVKLLTKLGLLAEEDTLKPFRDYIDKLHRQSIQFDTSDQLQEQREFYGKWAGAANVATLALHDLKGSRSKTTFDSAVHALENLATAIDEMTFATQVEELADIVPIRGNVPYHSKTYGIEFTFPVNVTIPPTHWLAYAVPGTMRTVGGRSLAYLDANAELATRIWDPGYYLGALLDCVTKFVTLLTILEPAFRATGFKRTELRMMETRLRTFVAAWRRNLFVTEVDTFFSPYAFAGSGIPVPNWARVSNPPFQGAGIPLGAIDPVSGISIFEPFWQGPMQFETVPDALYVINNAEETKQAANSEIARRLKVVEFICGIPQLEDLANQLGELTQYGSAVGPSTLQHIKGGSLFAEIANLGRYEIISTAQESGGFIDPYFIDPYYEPPVSNNPELSTINIDGILTNSLLDGELYQCEKKARQSNFEFDIPIVRRMDATRIQLGYKVLVSIGSDQPNSAELFICDFSAPIAPSEDEGLPLFPGKPAPVTLRLEDANLYCVIQSKDFSDKEEEAFALDQLPADVIRLLTDKQSGAAAIQIGASMTFEKDDPSFPYMGRAHIKIRNLIERSPLGFVVSVTIVEKARTAYLGYASDAAGDIGNIENVIAGQARLCIAPTYYIPEKKFFKDRIKHLVKLPKLDH